MGPVRQNPIRELLVCSCVCIALCTIVAHNITQNRPDSFPPYPPDNHHCSDDVYLREGVAGFGKEDSPGSMGMKVPYWSPGAMARYEVWETSLQKPAIFCKLYYVDVIWKKAKQ